MIVFRGDAVLFGHGVLGVRGVDKLGLGEIGMVIFWHCEGHSGLLLLIFQHKVA